MCLNVWSEYISKFKRQKICISFILHFIVKERPSLGKHILNFIEIYLDCSFSVSIVLFFFMGMFRKSSTQRAVPSATKLIKTNFRFTQNGVKSATNNVCVSMCVSVCLCV